MNPLVFHVGQKLLQLKIAGAAVQRREARALAPAGLGVFDFALCVSSCAATFIALSNAANVTVPHAIQPRRVGRSKRVALRGTRGTPVHAT